MRSNQSFSLILLLACSPLFAATALEPACGVLCGDWLLDSNASDAPEQVLDAAFAKFKDPRPRHRPAPPPPDADVAAIGAAEDADSLGPTFTRLPRDSLREELRQMMRQPAELHVAATGKDIRLSTEAGPANPSRLTPGEPHARIDRYGTASVSANWKGPRLVIVEKYDRSNRQDTTFSLRGADGAMEIQQVIKRSGLPTVSFQTVYRRAAPSALESGP